MNELSAVLALSAGLSTAAVVCRGINVGLATEALLAPVAVLLAYLSLSIGSEAWLSALSFLAGYCLAVVMARSMPPDVQDPPKLLDHDSLHRVHGRGRE